ncbi:hypothetical protein LguiA_032637 [Lonicera macranthoides]
MGLNLMYLAQTSRLARLAREEIKLKFIDSCSKFRHGRFQTVEEKQKFYIRVAQGLIFYSNHSFKFVVFKVNSMGRVFSFRT